MTAAAVLVWRGPGAGWVLCYLIWMTRADVFGGDFEKDFNLSVVGIRSFVNTSEDKVARRRRFCVHS